MNVTKINTAMATLQTVMQEESDKIEIEVRPNGLYRASIKSLGASQDGRTILEALTQLASALTED